MNSLDDYKLYFEKLPYETRDLLINSHKRAQKILHSKAVQKASKKIEAIASFRLFRRVREVENKLDKPFLYDSALLERIEKIEEIVDTVIIKPAKRKYRRAAKGTER